MNGNYYFVLTKNCNFKCAHCYISAGPGMRDTTIEEQDFQKCINHLPAFKGELCLSGGEVFTIKDKLYSFLDYLKYDNKKRERKNQGKLELVVQTNGSWGKSDGTAVKILQELFDFGVRGLDLTSADIFHRQQGMKKEWLLKIKKEAEKIGFKGEHIIIRGAGKQFGIFPLGRGKSFYDPNHKFTRTTNCKYNLTDYSLTFHQDGTVYNCCWGIFPLPGNLIREPLTRIVERAKKNSRLNTIDKEGILKLAEHDGFQKQEVQEIIKEYGKCIFCVTNYVAEENQ